ncbi:hypothetical protein [Nocardia gipuzkoensis]|uniref:hypothetical protein n=1 Tax=Nocardia gipuzkoensis TaxID=2749991 RepID=UPI003EE1B76F
MEREHEEAMRADFTTYAELERQMFRPSVTEYEIELIDMRQHELAGRWESGPHAEHWRYLNDAYEDWRRSPDTMLRLVDNLAHNGGEGATEVERRSLLQAGQLAVRDSQTVRDAFERHTNPTPEQPKRARGVQRGR